MQPQWLGIALRVVFVYVFMLVTMRLSGKTFISSGKQGNGAAFKTGNAFSLIVALVISDLPDDIIFGSVPLAQGIVAIGTLVLLHLVVGYLSMRAPLLSRLIVGEPAMLFQYGRLVRSNLRRERFSEEEFDAALRERAIEQRDEVKEARLEPSGQLSVLRTADAEPAQKSDLPDASG